jgi:hypothetical protein
MKSILAVLLVFTIGCGSAAPIRFGAVKDPAFKVEEKPLPPRPDEKPIPPEKDWAVPLVKDAPAPKSGVLLSVDKTVRAAKYKSRYNELRTLYELDKHVWRNVSVINDEQFAQANRTIKDLTPGWWDGNKGTVAFIAGIVIGGTMTIFVVYGVDQALEN